MALNFPSGVSVGYVYTYLGKSWTWDGSIWIANNVGIQGAQGTTGAQGTSGASILGTNNTWTGTNAFTSLSATGAVTLTGTSSILNFTDSGSGTSRNWRIATSEAAEGDFLIQVSSAANLTPSISALGFDRNGNAAFTGNVGIGTTSPAANLEVSTATTSEIRSTITSSAGNVARLRLKSPVSDYAWYVADNVNALVAYDYNAGAERMRIDSSGNFLVGTTSSNGIITAVGSTQISHKYTGSSSVLFIGQYNSSGDASINNTANGPLVFATNNTERARIDSSGNVGIGTASPSTYGKFVSVVSGSGGPASAITNSGVAVTGSGTSGVLAMGIDATGSFYTWIQSTNTSNSSYPLALNPNGGNVGIGTTSPSSSKLVIESDGTTFGTYGSTINLTAASGTRYHILFRENGTERGSITSNGTTVAYNSVSDYRLKDITGSLTDSGTFIDALKPKVGTWKADGSKFVGFVAHEFAEVSPSSVTGEKDAVDSDGKPVYQAMQASSAEVIANLVAELQSLRQRVAALESK